MMQLIDGSKRYRDLGSPPLTVRRHPDRQACVAASMRSAAVRTAQRGHRPRSPTARPSSCGPSCKEQRAAVNAADLGLAPAADLRRPDRRTPCRPTGRCRRPRDLRARARPPPSERRRAAPWEPTVGSPADALEPPTARRSSARLRPSWRATDGEHRRHRHDHPRPRTSSAPFPDLIGSERLGARAPVAPLC